MEKTSQATRAEKKVKELENAKSELVSKDDEMNKLRTQLHLEKLKGSVIKGLSSVCWKYLVLTIRGARIVKFAGYPDTDHL